MSLNIDTLISLGESTQINKWELDNVVWNERTTNPDNLLKFLKRIEYLDSLQAPSALQTAELKILNELAADMDQEECENLFVIDDDVAKNRFIENLARQGALETLCNDALSLDTMEKMCKLSPGDFILAAKRSQDLINSIQELVIQGETLSNEVAGA
jgi:hypothetical protein